MAERRSISLQSGRKGAGNTHSFFFSLGMPSNRPFYGILRTGGDHSSSFFNPDWQALVSKTE